MENRQLKSYYVGFCLFSLSNFTLDCTGFHRKQKLENNSISFLNKREVETLVLNNKDVEDISRWREDMNFIFEWQEQYQ